jgi:hypothetical protein
MRFLISPFVLVFLVAPVWCLAEGGADTGGGNRTVIPINRSIHRLIEETKLSVLAWANARHIQYKVDVLNGSPNALDTKLFGGTLTLFDLIHKVQIQNWKNRPCKDHHGNDSDGSYSGSLEDDKPIVCISSFRIAPKLDPMSAPSEIAALVLHELGHLMGLDEPTSIQENAVKLFYQIDRKVIELDVLQWVQYSGNGVDYEYYPLNRTYSNLSGWCQNLENVIRNIYEYDRALRIERNPKRIRLYLLSSSLFENFQDARAKLASLKHYVCSRDPKVPDADRNRFASEYENIFGIAKNISVPIFVSRSSYTAYLSTSIKTPTGVMVKKITDESVFHEEYNFIAQVFGEVENELSLLLDHKFIVKDI